MEFRGDDGRDGGAALLRLVCDLPLTGGSVSCREDHAEGARSTWSHPRMPTARDSTAPSTPMTPSLSPTKTSKVGSRSPALILLILPASLTFALASLHLTPPVTIPSSSAISSRPLRAHGSLRTRGVFLALTLTPGMRQPTRTISYPSAPPEYDLCIKLLSRCARGVGRVASWNIRTSDALMRAFSDASSSAHAFHPGKGTCVLRCRSSLDGVKYRTSLDGVKYRGTARNRQQN